MLPVTGPLRAAIEGGSWRTGLEGIPAEQRGVMRGKNIAISGLTAAGKTTHAKILAAELEYSYVSATEIMADMLGINRSEVGPGFWQKHGDSIAKIRDATDLDRELDNRLTAMVTVGMKVS